MPRSAPPGELASHSSTEPSVIDCLNECEWLIDNAATYERLVQSIQQAERSVWMMQLAFDADCETFVRDDGEAAATFAGALAEASRERAVDLRILLNATLLMDTTAALRRFLLTAGADAATAQVRGIRRFPQLLHAKVMIVDGHEAFLIGSPFANGYWDTERHRPVDGRRAMRELGGRPLHDVSVCITGGAVVDLERIFTELWNVSSGPDGAFQLPAVPDDVVPDSERSIIALTAPQGLLPARADGPTDILDACVDAIGRARSLIYIEHQYLSARPVIRALLDALAREPALEIVAVLNQNADITAYRLWQVDRLGRTGLLTHPRVGLFSLWSTSIDARGGPLHVNQIFVHSKVLIIDDECALVGSANLDGVSLHSYGDDFANPLGRWVFRDVRNVDVCAVIREDAQSGRRGAIGELRARLWGEHLGQSPHDVSGRPVQGWLTQWRSRAALNVNALNDGRELSGAILPYSLRATPERQLREVGVRLNGRMRLHFNPGWMEVHFSPNWIRNMFA